MNLFLYLVNLYSAHRVWRSLSPLSNSYVVASNPILRYSYRLGCMAGRTRFCSNVSKTVSGAQERPWTADALVLGELASGERTTPTLKYVLCIYDTSNCFTISDLFDGRVSVLDT